MDPKKGKPELLGVLLRGSPLQGWGEAATRRAAVWLQLHLTTQRWARGLHPKRQSVHPSVKWEGLDSNIMFFILPSKMPSILKTFPYTSILEKNCDVTLWEAPSQTQKVIEGSSWNMSKTSGDLQSSLKIQTNILPLHQAFKNTSAPRKVQISSFKSNFVKMVLHIEEAPWREVTSGL